MTGWFRPPPPPGRASRRPRRAGAGLPARAGTRAPVVPLHPVPLPTAAELFDPLEERLRHDLPALADALVSGALAAGDGDAREPAARPLVPRGALIAFGAPVDTRPGRWRRPLAAAAAGLVALSGLGLLLRTTTGSSRITTDPAEVAGVAVSDRSDRTTGAVVTVATTGGAAPGPELGPVSVVPATIVASMPDPTDQAGGGTGSGGSGTGGGSGGAAPGVGGTTPATVPVTTRPAVSPTPVPTTPVARASTTTGPTITVTGTGGTDRLPLGLANPGQQFVVRGAPVQLAMKASGGDGSARTWSAAGLPPGLSINRATGVISGRPLWLGVSSVQVTVRDATASTNQGFTVVVL